METQIVAKLLVDASQAYDELKKLNKEGVDLELQANSDSVRELKKKLTALQRDIKLGIQLDKRSLNAATKTIRDQVAQFTKAKLIIDRSDIFDALRDVGKLQRALQDLSTNIQIGVETNQDDIEVNQKVIAVPPKDSEDVRELRQSATSEVKTSMSDEFKTAAEAGTNTKGSTYSDAELVGEVKGVNNRLDTLIDLTSQKVDMYKGEDSTSDDSVIVEPEINIDNRISVDQEDFYSTFAPESDLNSFASDTEQERVEFANAGTLASDQGISDYLNRLGEEIMQAFEMVSDLPILAAPEVEGSNLLGPNTKGTANRQSLEVQLNPQVIRGLLRADGSMDKEDLNTLVHELRHISQELLARREGTLDVKEFFDNQPRNEKEARLVERVREVYTAAGANENSLEREFDAHLFAERFTDAVAGAIGATYSESTNLDNARDQAASLRETIDANFEGLITSTDEASIKAFNRGIDVATKALESLEEKARRAGVDLYPTEEPTIDRAIDLSEGDTEPEEPEVIVVTPDTTIGEVAASIDSEQVESTDELTASNQVLTETLLEAAGLINQAVQEGPLDWDGNTEVNEPANEEPVDTVDRSSQATISEMTGIPNSEGSPDDIESIEDTPNLLGFSLNTDTFEELDEALSELPNGIGDIYSQLTELGGLIGSGLGIAGLVGLLGSMQVVGNQVKEAMDGLTTILSTIGSSQAAESLSLVRDLAVGLGVDITETAAALGSFASSTDDTALESQTNRIFKAVASYGSAIGVASEDITRGFTAIQQIAAKGVVSLEELNGQLSEALPGANQIAAASLGLTLGELNDLVSTGSLLADDLLPAFTAALEAVNARAAVLAKPSLSQEMDKLGNSLKFALAEATGTPINLLTKALVSLNSIVSKSESLGKIMKIVFGSLTAVVAAMIVKMLMATVTFQGFAVAVKSVRAVDLTNWFAGWLSNLNPAILSITILSAALSALSAIANDTPMQRYFKGLEKRAKDSVKVLKSVVAEAANLNEQLDARENPEAEPDRNGSRLSKSDSDDFKSRTAGLGGLIYETIAKVSQDYQIGENKGLTGLVGSFIDRTANIAGVQTSNFKKEDPSDFARGANPLKNASDFLTAGRQGREDILSKDVDNAISKVLREASEVVLLAKESTQSSSFAAEAEKVREGTSALNVEKSITDALEEFINNSRDGFNPAQDNEAEAVAGIIAAAQGEGLDELAGLLEGSTTFAQVDKIVGNKQDDISDGLLNIQDSPALKQITNFSVAITDFEEQLKNGVGMSPEEKSTLRAQVTALKQHRETLLDLIDPLRLLARQMEAQIEEAKAQRDRQDKGSDLLATQSETAIRMEALRTGNIDQSSLEDALNINVLQRNQQQVEQSRERLEDARGYLRDQDPQQVLRLESTLRMNQRDAGEEPDADINNLSISDLEYLLELEQKNISPAIKVALEEYLGAALDNAEVETAAASESAEIAIEKARDQQGDADRFYDIENVYNDKVKAINTAYSDAIDNLNASLDAMFEELTDRILSVSDNLERVELEKTFAKLNNDLKAISGDIESSELGDAFQQAIDAIVGGAEAKAGSDLELTQLARQIENEFQDNLSRIQDMLENFAKAVDKITKDLKKADDVKEKAERKLGGESIAALDNPFGTDSLLDDAVDNVSGKPENDIAKAFSELADRDPQELLDSSAAIGQEVSDQTKADLVNTDKVLYGLDNQAAQTEELIGVNEQVLEALNQGGNSGGAQIFVEIRDYVKMIAENIGSVGNSGMDAAMIELANQINQSRTDSLKAISATNTLIAESNSLAGAYTKSTSEGTNSRDLGLMLEGNKRLLNAQLAELRERKAMLDSQGIENNIVVPEAADVNRISENRSFSQSENGFAIVDTGIKNINKALALASVDRTDMERALINRGIHQSKVDDYGNNRPDESFVREQANKFGIEYVAPSYITEENLRTGTTASSSEGSAATLKAVSTQIAEGLGSLATSQEALVSDLPSMEAIELEAPEGLATVDSIRKLSANLSPELQLKVENNITKSEELRDIQGRELDARDSLAQENERGSRIDAANTVKAANRSVNRDSDERLENLQKEIDNLNLSPLARKLADAISDDNNAIEESRANIEQLSEEFNNASEAINKKSAQLATDTSLTKEQKVAIEEAANALRASLPIYSAAIAKENELIAIREKALATNKAISEQRIKAEFETQGRLNGQQRELDANLNREGGSGLFADGQSLTQFENNQELDNPQRIADLTREYIELSDGAMDFEEANRLAIAEVEKLESIELDNFKDNINDLKSAVKDFSKDTFRGLFDINLMEGDIGGQLVDMLRGALGKLQTWAANYVTDSIYDLIFNRDKLDNPKEANRVGGDLIDAIEQDASKRKDANVDAAKVISEGETEAAELIAGNRGFLQENMAGLAGGAGLALTGAVTGSGTATGSGIGTILGTVAGAFLGNSGLGGAIGGGLGGIIGGLFYDGAEDIGEDSQYANMPIKEAMRIERQMSGRKPVLGVLHEGEAVLSTRNNDAQAFRKMKQLGIWDSVKSNVFYAGSDNIGGSATLAMPQSMGGKYSNSSTSTSVTNNNFNITATSNDVVDYTSKQMNEKRRRLGI